MEISLTRLEALRALQGILDEGIEELDSRLVTDGPDVQELAARIHAIAREIRGNE